MHARTRMLTVGAAALLVAAGGCNSEQKRLDRLRSDYEWQKEQIKDNYQLMLSSCPEGDTACQEKAREYLNGSLTRLDAWYQAERSKDREAARQIREEWERWIQNTLNPVQDIVRHIGDLIPSPKREAEPISRGYGVLTEGISDTIGAYVSTKLYAELEIETVSYVEVGGETAVGGGSSSEEPVELLEPTPINSTTAAISSAQTASQEGEVSLIAVRRLSGSGFAEFSSEMPDLNGSAPVEDTYTLKVDLLVKNDREIGTLQVTPIVSGGILFAEAGIRFVFDDSTAQIIIDPVLGKGVLLGRADIKFDDPDQVAFLARRVRLEVPIRVIDGHLCLSTDGIFVQAPYMFDNRLLLASGDWNGDGVVNSDDIDSFQIDWSMNIPATDLNADGVIDSEDSAIFDTHYDDAIAYQSYRAARDGE